MGDLNNSTTSSDCSAEPCTQLRQPFMKKQSISILNKYAITLALILSFGTCLSGQALAERDHSRNRTPRDSSAPVIQATVNGTQGANGWYTSNVSVTWKVSDPESTVSSKSGCANVSLTTDTSGVTYTCQATSSGGSSSKSVTIKRDATPPKSTIVTPGSGATYTPGQVVKASYSCTDATSGVSACTGTVANGSNLNLSTAGTKNFSVIASDKAGNQSTSSRSYTVGSGGNTGILAAILVETQVAIPAVPRSFRPLERICSPGTTWACTVQIPISRFSPCCRRSTT